MILVAGVAGNDFDTLSDFLLPTSYFFNSSR